MLDRKSIEQLDSQNMLSSIEVLDKQCTDAWDATKNTEFPDSYKNIDRVVLFGMGGSALGIHVVKTLFADQVPVPIEIINGYAIPASVNENTLAILSSYSGTTEEVVTVSQTILEKTKNVFVITTGGDLQKFAEDNSLPTYIFDPQFNPSKQPRMAVGYSVMGTLGAFSALDLINLSDDQVKTMAATLADLHSSIGADIDESDNKAKQLASAIHGNGVIIISSEFTEGSAHVMTNQINENGKHFAARFPIPEMNHHLIEGLVHPRAALDNMVFVFVTSELYHERVQTRHKITQQVLERNNITPLELNLSTATKFEQAFELLAFGSYVSFYLAILNDLDPSPIPNVDFLKSELKKS